jgi:hypothetical protein
VDEVPDPVVDLDREYAQCHQAMNDGRLEEAEEGLRTLLVTARRVVGPDDPRIFMIQSDLSLVLLALRRVPLATDLALDAVDEAVARLGERHPVTATVAHGTLRLLIYTASTEEVAAFFDSRLAWLLNVDPDELSEQLRMVRDLLLNLGSAGERGTPS